MINTKNFKRTLLFLMLFIFTANAQSLQENSGMWFGYIGQYKVTNKIGYHAEIQGRLDEKLHFSKQNLFRVGVHYFINKKASATLGYGLINTYSATYLDYFREDRIWQQFQYIQKYNSDKHIMQHRFRLEQRFVDKLGFNFTNVVVTETDFLNRLRYLNRNTVHLKTLNNSGNSIYAIVQDEVFINPNNKNENTSFLDQNRFLIGLGVNYQNSIKLELGYLNHYINTTSGSNLMNHTVSLMVNHTLDFVKN